MVTTRQRTRDSHIRFRKETVAYEDFKCSNLFVVWLYTIKGEELHTKPIRIAIEEN